MESSRQNDLQSDDSRRDDPNEDQLDQILKALKTDGRRITPQRTEIARTLLQMGIGSAQNIYRAVRHVFPQISLDTVYRNLRLLTEKGLAQQINLQSDEDSLFEPLVDSGHHHHVICLQCGENLCIDFCPIEDRLKASLKKAKQSGFEITRHAFEIYGYCSSCR